MREYGSLTPRSIEVAALYVQTGGCYYGLEGVDPWDKARDARTYTGPHPVVAHPPCERWSSLNNLVLCRYPHRADEFAHGNDGGTFAAALQAVRTWGGVLEHPAQSRAWWTFDLPAPGRGVWQRGICGGWSIEIDQAGWGHSARKRTWLYAFGVDVPVLAPQSAKHSGKFVRVYRKRLPDGTWKRMTPYAETSEITHRAAKATPPEFRDLLLSIARTASRKVALAGLPERNREAPHA